MLSVSHRIQVGGAELLSGDSSRLLDLATYASLRWPVNRCRLVIDAASAPQAKLGDPLVIELGDADTLKQVFSGTVGVYEQGLQNVIIEAFGACIGLTNLFQHALYEKQAAGAIVSDILSKNKLQKGQVEDGLTFTSYALSGQISLIDHLLELARRCGFDLYADQDDKIVFKAYDPKKTHSFAYGEQILAFEATPAPPTIAGVEVYGASPAGQGQSEEASSWLSKKEVKGSAGKTSGNVLRMSDATARTKDQAGIMADNLFKALTSGATGKVRLLGAPAAGLGDAIAFSKLASSAYNATFRITAVRHRLNRRRGFVSDIAWEER